MESMSEATKRFGVDVPKCQRLVFWLVRLHCYTGGLFCMEDSIPMSSIIDLVNGRQHVELSF